MNLFDPTPPRRVTLEQPGGDTVAAEVIDGSGPAIVFLSGYGADMTGTKASWLAEQCAIWGWRFIRFDYRGRGQSGGERGEGTLSRHLEDIGAVVDQLTDRPVILVGSSMGGWLALRYAQHHRAKVAALVGIAAAPDFTIGLPESGNDYVQADFIADAKQHLMLHQPVAITCPVELLHGQRDLSVPAETASRIMAALETDAVTLHLVKDGEHSLSRPQDLRLLWQVLTRVREQLLPAEG